MVRMRSRVRIPMSAPQNPSTLFGGFCFGLYLRYYIAMHHPEMRRDEGGRGPSKIDLDFSLSDPSLEGIEVGVKPEEREVPEGMIVAEPSRAVETSGKRVKENVSRAKNEREVFEVWRNTSVFDARALMSKIHVGDTDRSKVDANSGVPKSFRIGPVDYKLDEHLGSGGMGAVYLANGSNGVEYAVKLMRMVNPRSSIRAVQEASIQSGISPGIHAGEKQPSSFVEAFSDRYKGHGYASPEVYEVVLVEDDGMESLLIVMERMESTLKERSKEAMKKLKNWGGEHLEPVGNKMTQEKFEQALEKVRDGMTDEELKLAREKAREVFVEQGINDALSLARNVRGMHTFGIAHRDIKPSNIFTNKEGELHFGDFGISYSKRERGDQDDHGYQMFMNHVTQIYALAISGVEVKTPLTDQETAVLLNFTRDVIDHLYDEASEYAQWKEQRTRLVGKAEELIGSYEDYFLEPDVVLKTEAYMAEGMMDRQMPQNTSSAVTEPGIVMGTPLFMSPEAARGQMGSRSVEALQRSDDFSLGLTLFQHLHLGTIGGGSAYDVMRDRISSGVEYTPVPTFSEEAGGERVEPFYLSRGVTPISHQTKGWLPKLDSWRAKSDLETTALLLDFANDPLLQRLESAVLRLVAVYAMDRISLDDFIEEVELIETLQAERSQKREDWSGAITIPA